MIKAVKSTLKINFTTLSINALQNDHSHIKRSLSRLIESHTFSKSPVNRELLKYLVSCSLKGEKPKEFQIAADVFGKKYDPDKEVNVRVYMHNLRKKLEEYYAQEGQEDELIFELPKGQYAIHFNHSPIKSLKRKVYRFSPWLAASSLLLLIGILLFQLVISSNPVTIDFWKAFFAGGHPTKLILGDHYFYRGPIPSSDKGSIRDSRINSDQDFDAFLQSHPELVGHMEKTNLTYINNQAPIGLFYLMQVFGGGHFSLKMDYSSRIKIDDFRDQNLLFVGSFKTLHELKSTVEKLGLTYRIEETMLEYHTADTTLHFDNRSTDYLNYEHAVVAQFELPDKRQVLFFLCDNDIGNMALLKYFTDPLKMKPFNKQLKALKSSNFKAVFEVKGEDRTDFNIRLIRMDALPSNMAEIWP
ncbi:helix-turn-helix domain-containing protein [uncultured Sunxiuqinia sp.]|uniref:helix-turn-helix domain-containing protein n=1 Tax=uncultured Sunxiuqinia sp. TaxID=1573825 RepID=UPI0026327D02|nr:helix-turn-helix domain-containing protein [uncultured Sunxiuqinia sp.]